MAPMILMSRRRYAMLWYINSFSSFLAVVIVIIIPCFASKGFCVNHGSPYLSYQYLKLSKFVIQRNVSSVLVKAAASRSNTIGLADDICMARWQLREHLIEVRHMLLVERDDLEEVSTLRS